MSITVEEGRTYLLDVIERERVTRDPMKMHEVANLLLLDIHVDHPDMKISEIGEIIFPIVEELLNS